ncbi:MAG: GatB/YqeY domain-containing protein [Dehalococcoidia bacterium]
MTLQERLSADLKQAMKGGDIARRSVIRLLMAGVKNAEIDKGGPLDDSGVVEVISREVKRHRESIAEFSKGNRQDLVAEEEAELAILFEYLPKQMSREEIAEAARRIIEQVGAREPGDKGRVMSQLMPQLKGKAEGREVSDMVSELLAGS